MRNLQLFVEDDRYSVPTLVLITVQDIPGAREVAERVLRESKHHLGVEVVEAGDRLFAVGLMSGLQR